MGPDPLAADARHLDDLRTRLDAAADAGARRMLYADLLADSVPDSPAYLASSRRDLDGLAPVVRNHRFWAQNERKLAFVRDACRGGAGRVCVQRAEAATVSPAAPPFARYEANERGEVFVRGRRVFDLRAFAGLHHEWSSGKYGKEWNKRWTSEHDAWKSATASVRELEALDKFQWLESRIFSLDLEITRTKLRIAQLEAKRTVVRDVFGLLVERADGN